MKTLLRRVEKLEVQAEERKRCLKEMKRTQKLVIAFIGSDGEVCERQIVEIPVIPAWQIDRFHRRRYGGDSQ